MVIFDCRGFRHSPKPALLHSRVSSFALVTVAVDASACYVSSFPCASTGIHSSHVACRMVLLLSSSLIIGTKHKNSLQISQDHGASNTLRHFRFTEWWRTRFTDAYSPHCKSTSCVTNPEVTAESATKDSPSPKNQKRQVCHPCFVGLLNLSSA